MKMYALVFFKTSVETFVIFRIIQRGIVINVKNLHVYYPLFWSDFNETLFFDIFSKNAQVPKFYKIPSSASLVFPCGRTD
jgi:hypothetical protein